MYLKVDIKIEDEQFPYFFTDQERLSEHMNLCVRIKQSFR